MMDKGIPYIYIYIIDIYIVRTYLYYHIHDVHRPSDRNFELNPLLRPPGYIASSGCLTRYYTQLSKILFTTALARY